MERERLKGIYIPATERKKAQAKKKVKGALRRLWRLKPLTFFSVCADK
jgi:hypothetical protein